MSMTANEVLTDAMRTLKLLASEESMTSAELVDGLRRMNNLMHGFGPRGIAYAHTTLSSTTVVNVPDELVGSLIWLVAEALAPEHGYTFTPDERNEITRAENALQAAYHIQPPAQSEPMLRGHRLGYSDITRG